VTLDWLGVSAGRLLARERALRAWEAAGGDVGRCTDWPGRWAGRPEWRACPAPRVAGPGKDKAA
jgi:hypothetical protein